MNRIIAIEMYFKCKSREYLVFLFLYTGGIWSSACLLAGYFSFCIVQWLLFHADPAPLSGQCGTVLVKINCEAKSWALFIFSDESELFKKKKLCLSLCGLCGCRQEATSSHCPSSPRCHGNACTREQTPKVRQPGHGHCQSFRLKHAQDVQVEQN